MFARVQSFLAPPVFEDEPTNRKAKLLNSVLIAIALLLTMLWFVRLATGFGHLISTSMMILAALDLVIVGLLFALRRGYVDLSVSVLVLCAWLAITVLAWNADGVRDSAISAYFIVMLVASLLSGWRLALSIIGLTLGAGWAFVYAESVGLIASSADPASNLMTDYSFVFALAGVLAYLVVDGLQKTLSEAKENNRSLQKLSQQLEESVQERTRQLAVAAEVGQRISHMQDLDKLLAESVELIREQFGLYHAQIYLADANGQNLNLRASTGSIGQQLLNRGHRLPIQPGSINGTAAFSKEPVLVADTRNNPLFQQNPLLPYTRSELAVPLMVGGKLLGVLDLQSDRPEALTTENVSIYSSLADQLAVAVDNAYLLREAEVARQEVEQHLQQITYQGWKNFLDGIEQKERIGVRYDTNALEPYDGPIVANADSQVLQIPISVGNVSIGTIQLEAAENEKWTDETRALVTAVARQVGQQAENVRLLTETARYRIDAERAARRLGGQTWHEYLGRANDHENVEGFIYRRNIVAPITKDASVEKHESGADAFHYPLTIQNKTIGEFVIAGAGQNEAREIVAIITQQLSSHIESIRLAEQTEKALGQTQSLHQIGQELNQATQVAEILHAALGPVFPTGIDEATLMFIEVDGQGQPETLELLATWRLDGNPSFPVGTVFPIERFPFTSLFINEPEVPQLIGNAAADERVDEFTKGVMAQARIKAIAVIPLTMGGQWVGIITCSWPQPRTFSQAEEEIFNALINLAAPAVQSQRLYYKTKEQADRERLINEINQRIQNTVSLESALQTAVKELGKALQTTSEVRWRWRSGSEPVPQLNGRNKGESN